jgi:hypothetical protein
VLFGTIPGKRWSSCSGAPHEEDSTRMLSDDTISVYGFETFERKLSDFDITILVPNPVILSVLLSAEEYANLCKLYPGLLY